jgi:hypothetical protein
MTRFLTSRLLFAAVGVTLVAGGFGIVMALLPVRTDAAVGPGSAGLPQAACQAQLADAQTGFSMSLQLLGSVAQSGATARCAAYRTHLAALTTATDIYGRCFSGFARADQVGQLELAAANWRSVISSTCGD